MMKIRCKRIVSLVVALLLIVTVNVSPYGFGFTVDALSGDVEFAGGDGSETRPYQISTPEQLSAIRSDLSAHYVIVNDIDMSNFGNWTPIGRSGSLSGSTLIEDLPYVEEQLFEGTLNGNGYCISNLTINDSSSSFENACFGLFAAVNDDGSVKNLNLKDIDYSIDKSAIDYVEIWEDYGASYAVYVGGIAGKSSTAITNCTVSGTISVTHCNDARVGGIAGYGTATGCVNSANIFVNADRDSRYKQDATIQVGGIVGHTATVNGNVTKCINNGDISATGGNFAYVGGITGEYGRIENCANFGNVSGGIIAHSLTSSFAGNSNVGGIVGATSSDYTRYCVNYGNVSSSSIYRASGYAGGIAGFCGYYSSGNINNCVNISDKIVSTTLDKDGNAAFDDAGRIAGYVNKISNCSSFEGTTVNGSTISSSAADDKNGKSCTSAQLLAPDAYPGFDFDTIWQIDTTIGGAIPIISSQNKDSDGDGIPDEWEINGIDTNGDGVPEVDLKAMGADPRTPDVFVEVDWMVRPAKKVLFWETKGEHSFKPSDNVLRLVFNAFKAHGINLHIDAGSNSTDYVTGNKWGSLSGGNEVTYTKHLKANTDISVWNNLIDMDETRKLVFHHCLFADYLYSNSNTTSGLTPDFGQFFAVTLGGWGSVNDMTIAGTFMHELGHSLGLRHGGVDHEHYKPNYLSIMNYAYQTTGLTGTGALNYSDYKLPDIDESAINESDGIDPIGQTGGTNLGAILFYKSSSQRTVNNISKSSIDFNQNGVIDTNISMDLNPKGAVEDATISILRGHNDWDGINYKSGLIGSGVSLDNIPTENIDPDSSVTEEKTLEESIETKTLALDGTGCVDLISSTVIGNVEGQKLYFDVFNLGSNDSTFTINIHSDLFLEDYSSDVFINGSVEKIEKNRIAVPVRSDAEIGEHIVTCSISIGDSDPIETTYTVNVYLPSEEELQELQRIIEEDSEEIDSDILNEIKRVIDIVTIENVSVTFDPNGGSGEMGPIVLEKDDTLTLPKCTFKAPLGKQFKAWRINGKNYSVGMSIKVTNNITVSAVWQNKVPVTPPTVTPTTTPTTAPTTAPTTPPNQMTVVRFNGTDRYDTANKISAFGWEKADIVIIASGENYPDALAGTVLARKMNAPILLVGKNGISTDALLEINRLGATKAYILGGTAAIPQSVENSLSTAGVNTMRFAGANRNDTAAMIAATIGKSDTVFLVSNAGFADALSISSVAAIYDSPILYLNADGSIPTETKVALDSLGCKKAYIIGGPAAIGSSAENSLSSLGIASERVYGVDRFATSIAVYDKFANMFTGECSSIATGNNFPDALAGAALASKNNAPVLLVGDNASAELKLRIEDANISTLYVFGGLNAVSNSVVDELK